MNRLLILFLFIPASLFCNTIYSGLLKIDVNIRVSSPGKSDLWSMDLVKYTVSDRAVSLNMKGWNGELFATMNPTLLSNGEIVLKTSSLIKSIDSNKIIKESSSKILVNFGEKIIFYPLGKLEHSANVFMEILINKIDGVDIEN